MAAYGAEAVNIDRNARDYKLADQIEWKGRPGSGNYSANLFGDPSKAGLYVQLLKRDANILAHLFVFAPPRVASRQVVVGPTCPLSNLVSRRNARRRNAIFLSMVQ